MALPVGSKAPDFSLKSGAEGFPAVRLSDGFASGPTVLLFFPAAFSSVCTEELCSLAKNEVPAFGTARVLGISVDSPFALAAFAKAERIETPLLSDYGREVIEAYDVVIEDFAGTTGKAAARAAFVIDREGVITYAYQSPQATIIPDFGPIREAIELIQTA